MSSSLGRKQVGFLHTTPTTIAMVTRFMAIYLPDVDPVHIYDGNVKIDNFKSPVGVTPKSNLLRWANFADQLERSGCAAVVSCCSLMPRATEFARQVVSIPCIQLDSVILDSAVKRFCKIAVLTTTGFTTPYVIEGLNDRAARIGKELELVFGGDPAALALFNAGEFERHDEIVLKTIEELASRPVDCVLLGQIPFALLDEAIRQRKWRVPVLYAGEDAWLRLREILVS